MAKYSNTTRDYWTYETVTYDSETLVKTIEINTGSIKNKKEISMTKEEMFYAIQKEYAWTLLEIQEEIKKIQQKYDERLARLEKFTKVLLDK